MGRQGEIECAAESVNIGALVCAGAAGILLQGCISWRTLVTNEKERARAVGGCFGVAQVNQHSRSIRSNANVIGLNIAVNDRRSLAMQEGDRVTNREQPFHQKCEGDHLIFLAHGSHVLRQIVAFDVPKHNIIMAALVESGQVCRQVRVMQVTKYLRFMLQLRFSTGAGHDIFFQRVQSLRLQIDR